MPLTLKDYGDAIEKDYAVFIESRLPGYYKIWQTYVGHDGNGHPLKIDGISEEDEGKRNRFVQYHYTALESIVSMLDILNTLSQLGIVSLDSEEGRKNYICSLNFFMAFYAHAGRIRDLVKKMSEIWNQAYLVQKFEEFYQQRNNVLHEAKLPIAFVEEALAILPPAGKVDEPEKWGRNRIWYKVDDNHFEFLQDFLKKFFEEILTQLNNFFEALFSTSIANYVEKHPIILPDQNETSTLSPTVSGSLTI